VTTDPHRRIDVKSIITLVTLGAFLAGGPALAQLKSSADVVEVAAAKQVVAAAPGARVAFTIEVDIAEPWHLYAHGDTSFIGVDLVPDETFPLQEFAAEYPEGIEGEFFGEKLRMIAGGNAITASALVPPGMAAGEHPLELALTVQACDDKTCLAPAKVPVALTLKVTAAE
jgi:thiol:disulfide interchange protein DsbD